MSFETWITFTLASTALLMIPGPTVLLVLSYALSKGRSVAVASAAGVALGDLVAMSASLAGLGALVLASSAAFTVLKWIGAAYLVYLGVRLFLSAPDSELALPNAAASVTPASVLRHNAAVTALNPKSIAFFIAFVPQFINAKAAIFPQALVLVVTFVGLAALNALLYALAADKLRSLITRPRVLTRLTQAGGSALIAMGLFTAALKRATP